MDATTVVEDVRPPVQAVPDTWQRAPKHLGGDERLAELQEEIVALHRLYRAGEVCESTYRRTLQRLEVEVAELSRAC